MERRDMFRRRWLSAVVLAVILGGVPAGLVCPAPAAAHDATTAAHAEVTGADTNVEVVLDLEYDLLMKSAWLYAEAYEAEERTERLHQLKINRDAVTDYVTGRFAVAYNDEPCAPTPVGDAAVRVRGKVAFAVLTYAYACADGDGDGGVHAISSALFPDAESFVHSTKTIVRYDLDGAQGSAVLVAKNPTLRIGEHPASHQVRDRSVGFGDRCRDPVGAGDHGDSAVLRAPATLPGG
ncbi:hypothetical protein ACIBF6_13780 [Streptosporangium amethystogenes]|uniref:hypothetical protein n=1 Tax=Streptosporangium amethystogenes TaxID=2002 RepID=UPI00379390E2